VPSLSRRRFLLGVAAAPVAAACGGGGDPLPKELALGTTTSTSTSTTSTTAPPVIQPLTGLVHVQDPLVLGRPALIVKINNIDSRPPEQARPQAGLNQADVVYEERTEGGITRFAAVFHSQDADPVFPVRSARLTDIEICAQFGRPLFANSGGNRIVMDAVHSANLVAVGHEELGNDYFYRLPDRRAPHNLATSTQRLYSASPAGLAPPAPILTYRQPFTPPAGGVPANGVQVAYGGGPGAVPVEHRFDGNINGWARIQNGTPHVDVAGVQVAPQNVIVQFIHYEGTRGVLSGEGEAWVFTGGHVVRGTWRRTEPYAPTAFIDAAGNHIGMEPGRTWILLPPPGGGVIL
jgi:hypothetical protein